MPRLPVLPSCLPWPACVTGTSFMPDSDPSWISARGQFRAHCLRPALAMACRFLRTPGAGKDRSPWQAQTVLPGAFLCTNPRPLADQPQTGKCWGQGNWATLLSPPKSRANSTGMCLPGGHQNSEGPLGNGGHLSQCPATLRQPQHLWLELSKSAPTANLMPDPVPQYCAQEVGA
jgi:hypothetical protein